MIKFPIPPEDKPDTSPEPNWPIAVAKAPIVPELIPTDSKEPSHFWIVDSKATAFWDVINDWASIKASDTFWKLLTIYWEFSKFWFKNSFNEYSKANLFSVESTRCKFTNLVNVALYTLNSDPISSAKVCKNALCSTL